MAARSFRYRLDDTRRLLVTGGELDERATVGLRKILAEATDGLTTGLTIDLSDVDFLPSSAVGVLAAAQASVRRHGADVVFVAREGTIAQRVLSLCGLHHLDAVPSTTEPA